jgi:catechol 2,3-dioxygenase-like lactoylglutathione lyase family enzyme
MAATSLDLFSPSHIGIVAADIDSAMLELGRTWRTSWAVGRDGKLGIPYRMPGGIQTVHFRSAWGARGPLRVELVQAVPGTIWAANGAMFMHHLGYAVDDLASESRRLKRLGLQLELTRAGRRAGSVNGFGYFRFPSGLLIELLARDVD